MIQSMCIQGFLFVEEQAPPILVNSQYQTALQGIILQACIDA